MRTQEEIQGDIRELRRQFDALAHKKSRRSTVITEDVHSTRLRAEILTKIKEFSTEYMNSLKANRY